MYYKCRSYKYEKAIYVIKQDLLISNMKNMLISNMRVTFKYKRYLCLQQIARHKIPKLSSA